MSTNAPAHDVACDLRALAKTFRVGFLGRKVVACRDITLQVARGEVFGLVGPNGAGKSTTMAMMLGVVRPDRGTGTLLGHALGTREARARVGYLPELPSFPAYLTAREVLDFHAALAGVVDAGWKAQRDALLDRVGLGRAAGVRLRTYSKGMLQRCALAVALCANPDILVLDEPMSGLDPLGRHDVRRIILEEHARGRTVIFSSHVLSDVQALCDRVAIISQGSVFRVGTLEEVARGTTAAVEVQLHGATEAHHATLRSLGALRVQGSTLVWELATPDAIDDALKLALQQGLHVRAVQPRQNTLEELILQANRAADGSGRISPT